MQLGIFAKTFSGSTPDIVLSSVARAGFQAAHYNWACSGLSSMPGEVATGLAERVAEESRKSHVRIVGLSATWNMAHPDPVQRKKGLERLDVMASQAHVIGTQLVTLCTGTRNPDDQWRFHPDNKTADAWRDMIETMRAAVMIAETHNLFLGIEPELANVVNNIEAATTLFNDISSPRLKLVLDPANLFESATPNEICRLVDDAIDTLGNRIAMAHAKDRNARGEFVAAGKGIVDFDHFVRTLRSAGFDGPLVTHGLTADEAPEVHAFLHNILGQYGCLS